MVHAIDGAHVLVVVIDGERTVLVCGCHGASHLGFAVRFKVLARQLPVVEGDPFALKLVGDGGDVLARAGEVQVVGARCHDRAWIRICFGVVEGSGRRAHEHEILGVQRNRPVRRRPALVGEGGQLERVGDCWDVVVPNQAGQSQRDGRAAQTQGQHGAGGQGEALHAAALHGEHGSCGRLACRGGSARLRRAGCVGRTGAAACRCGRFDLVGSQPGARLLEHLVGQVGGRMGVVHHGLVAVQRVGAHKVPPFEGRMEVVNREGAIQRSGLRRWAAAARSARRRLRTRSRCSAVLRAHLRRRRPPAAP